MDIFSVLLLIFFLVMVISALLNKYLPKWACTKFGWHVAPNIKGFDGCSINGECSRCGKRVMQDSQGNWF